jgi:hypothetical protein
LPRAIERGAKLRLITAAHAHAHDDGRLDACGCARLLRQTRALIRCSIGRTAFAVDRSHRTARMSVDERVALDVDVAIERFETTMDAMYKEISA